MGICCSRSNDPPSSSSSSAKIINDPSNSAKRENLHESGIRSQKTEAEQKEIENKTVIRTEEEENPRLEDEGKAKKEMSISKHRKSHERSKTSDSTISKHRKSHERSKTSDPKVEIEEKLSEDDKIKSQLNPNSVVRTSSCTKEEVDAILIQCGRLSRNNSPAATKVTRRYSGSKRSFDFDQNEKSIGGDTNTTADLEEEEEDDQRVCRTTHRQNHSPRERRRRAPSREREESKNQRSGSRERETGGSSSRRVSRSPGRRSENKNPSSGGGDGSGSIVNSSNIRAKKKMVAVPSTDKSCKTTAEPVKRKSASPRSQSPARGYSDRPPATLSRSSSRKREQSPYRRNPLEEIDSNVNRTGSGSGKGICNKKTAEFVDQKASSGSTTNNSKMAPSSTNCRAASPNRPIKQTQEVPEEPEMAGSEDKIVFSKPQSLTRSRSAKKSHDFDIQIPEETNLSSNKNNNPAPSSSYTALLLEDIQNFHQKNANVAFTVPQCVTNAYSILDAVADLNSTTNATSPLPDQTLKNDLMEPSFEKYSVEEIEEQESYGSNSFTGSSSLNPSSSSWELNSGDSTDRWSSRSSKSIGGRDQCSIGGFQRNADANSNKIRFDPLKNRIAGGRVGPATADSI